MTGSAGKAHIGAVSSPAVQQTHACGSRGAATHACTHLAVSWSSQMAMVGAAADRAYVQAGGANAMGCRPGTRAGTQQHTRHTATHQAHSNPQPKVHARHHPRPPLTRCAVTLASAPALPALLHPSVDPPPKAASFPPYPAVLAQLVARRRLPVCPTCSELSVR